MKKAIQVIMVVTLGLGFGLFGCGGSKEGGTEGGPCYGNNTCNDALSCVDGTCIDPNACAGGTTTGAGSGQPSGAGCETAPDGCPDIDWVTIEGGSFRMGKDMGDTWTHEPAAGTANYGKLEEEVALDCEDEQSNGRANCNLYPARQVTISAFEMGKTEVTVAQYRACVDAGACTEPDTSTAGSCLNSASSPNGEIECNWGEAGRDEYPINCVTWHQARAFSQWVGGDLPTEAEWEYAARSEGLDRVFPWAGNTYSCDYLIYAVAKPSGGLFAGCSQGRRAWSVCSKPQGNTEQGLCDMSGNVREFVLDEVLDETIKGIPGGGYQRAPTDGSAFCPTAGCDGEKHRARGGDFCNPDPGDFATFGRGTASSAGSGVTGFRVVKRSGGGAVGGGASGSEDCDPGSGGGGSGGGGSGGDGACAYDLDCEGHTPYCESGYCVECYDDSAEGGCAEDERCEPDTYICVPYTEPTTTDDGNDGGTDESDTSCDYPGSPPGSDIGSHIPDFDLVDSEGEDHSLHADCGGGAKALWVIGVTMWDGAGQALLKKVGELSTGFHACGLRVLCIVGESEPGVPITDDDLNLLEGLAHLFGEVTVVIDPSFAQTYQYLWTEGSHSFPLEFVLDARTMELLFKADGWPDGDDDGVKDGEAIVMGLLGQDFSNETCQ